MPRKKQAELGADSKDTRIAMEQLESHWKQWGADLTFWKIKMAMVITIKKKKTPLLYYRESLKRVD